MNNADCGYKLGREGGWEREIKEKRGEANRRICIQTT